MIPALMKSKVSFYDETKLFMKTFSEFLHYLYHFVFIFVQQISCFCEIGSYFRVLSLTKITIAFFLN